MNSKISRYPRIAVCPISGIKKLVYSEHEERLYVQQSVVLSLIACACLTTMLVVLGVAAYRVMGG